MKKWLIICGCYLILIMTDGFLTFFNTPELTMEANPMVVAGLGWGALITANLLVFALFCTLSYYPFVRYKSIAVKANNAGEFLSQLLFGQPDKLKWCLTKTPKNIKSIFAMSFYSVAYALLVSRSIVVLEWILITLNINLDSYAKFRNSLPLKRPDIPVFLLAYLFFILFWFLKELKYSIKFCVFSENNINEKLT